MTKREAIALACRYADCSEAQVESVTSDVPWRWVVSLHGPVQLPSAGPTGVSAPDRGRICHAATITYDAQSSGTDPKPLAVEAWDWR